MGEMYANILTLCSMHGITPSALMLKLGMSKSTMTELKKGRSKNLSMENAAKVAKYFCVSVDYLKNGGADPYNDESDSAPHVKTVPEDEFIAFYGEVKKDLNKADIEDLKTFMRMKAEIKRNK